MADYGRYGEADDRDRTRDFDRERRFDRDHDRGYERSRRDFFSGGEPAGALAPRGRDDRAREEFRNDDDRRSLPIDETNRLIASNKVEGTAVYGREGERLGTIYNFMVDKFSGQVEYAVMRYGGFLGMAQRYYPLPWRILTYDTREGGYRIDLTARDMERAPSFGREDEPRFSRDYGRRVHNWYGLDY